MQCHFPSPHGVTDDFTTHESPIYNYCCLRQSVHCCFSAPHCCGMLCLRECLQHFSCTLCAGGFPPHLTISQLSSCCHRSSWMSSPAALCYNALPHCLGSGWDPGTRIWQSLWMKASANVLTLVSILKSYVQDRDKFYASLHKWLKRNLVNLLRISMLIYTGRKISKESVLVRVLPRNSTNCFFLRRTSKRYIWIINIFRYIFYVYITYVHIYICLHIYDIL